MNLNLQALFMEMMWVFTVYISHVDYSNSKSGALMVVITLQIISSEGKTGHRIGFIQITLSQNIFFFLYAFI